MAYDGIALLSSQVKNMKYISIVYILLLFSVSVPYRSSAMELQKHKETSRTKSFHNQLSNSKSDDSTQYSITIIGQANEIKIDNRKSIRKSQVKANAQNAITITGEANTVAIHQSDKKGKVNISQNGNSNHVSILQSK